MRDPYQMKSVASSEIQNSFGSIANTVKGGEPVVVTQYGRPTMMILPYEIGREMLGEHAASRMAALLDSLGPVPTEAPELSDADINDLVHALRP